MRYLVGRRKPNLLWTEPCDGLGFSETHDSRMAQEAKMRPDRWRVSLAFTRPVLRRKAVVIGRTEHNSGHSIKELVKQWSCGGQTHRMSDCIPACTHADGNSSFILPFGRKNDLVPPAAGKKAQWLKGVTSTNACESLPGNVFLPLSSKYLVLTAEPCTWSGRRTWSRQARPLL